MKPAEPRARIAVASVRSATPGGRVVLAAAAGMVGWLVGSAVLLGLEALWSPAGRAFDDLGFYALYLGLFVGGAWTVSVLPLALFGNHARVFFHPAAAPVVGAACGALLLLLEYWIVFDISPAELAREGLEFGDVYFLSLAALIGAIIWSAYTVGVRLLRGRRS